MYIIRRLVGLGFLVGIYLICAGAYDAFIQAGTRRTPETISISELQKNVPANRHLVVTGGTPVLSKAVEYYRTRHGVREANSEIYFIPIQDSALPPSASTIPPLLLKMTKEQADKIKSEGGLDGSRVEGVRMTHWDLESKAKDYLVSAFGNSGVERMIILDYQRDVVGIWRGVGQSLGGFFLLGVLALASSKLDEPQRSKQTSPRLPMPVSSREPEQAASKIPTPSRRRRKTIIATLAAVVAVLICIAVVRNLKQWLPANLVSTRDDWSDWQLPIRIGDSLEAVRDKLGDESPSEPEKQKAAKSQPAAQMYVSGEKFWREKGISVFFENGRTIGIAVYTSDWPNEKNAVPVRKYDGPIIAGLTAADRLEDLIEKLGKPTEVTDFNPNDKDYLWRRKAYAIRTRVAMEDLVTSGIPFKAHQMEGVLWIDDIARYLQADRDEQLRRDRLEKEKALVTLSGATLSPSEIFKKYSGRVVEVEALNSKGAVASLGTGFLWRGTELLTNYHVVAQARDVRIKQGAEIHEARFQTGLSPSANLLQRFSHYSRTQDWIQLFLWEPGLVALSKDFRSPFLELPPVAYSTATPEVGESVTVIGNPEGLTQSLSTGIVSGIRRVGGNEWIQITAPVSHGSSGSPVFDSKGKLIGLATMMLVDGQNLNFATPISTIQAGISRKEVDPEELPLENVWKDQDYEQRQQSLQSGHFDSKEVQNFADEFLRKYSDPADQAEILYTLSNAYEAKGDYRTAAKFLEKKMKLFEPGVGDYWSLAQDLKNIGDQDRSKREFRAGVACGVRQFTKERFPENRMTAWWTGKLFLELYDEEGARQWFDIYVALRPDLADKKDSMLPKWYQTDRVTRGKVEMSLDRLAPTDAKTYLHALKERWVARNEKQIIQLMREFGLPADRANQISSIGLDTLSLAWWEQEVRPRLTQDQWLVLREKLDERKSMQGGF